MCGSRFKANPAEFQTIRGIPWILGRCLFGEFEGTIEVPFQFLCARFIPKPVAFARFGAQRSGGCEQQRYEHERKQLPYRQVMERVHFNLPTGRDGE
jgi:hypothetical protein